MIYPDQNELNFLIAAALRNFSSPMGWAILKQCLGNSA
jgi:hypothetical protein